MCCFTHPARVITLPEATVGTRILGAIIKHQEYGRIATMIYSNSVTGSDKPNAMIGVVFTDGSWIEDEKILELHGQKVTEKASKTIWPPLIARRPTSILYGTRDLIGARLEPARTTVSHAQDYSLIVSNNAAGIPDALKLLPADRRPEPNMELLSFLEKTYEAEGFRLWVACWPGGSVSGEFGFWFRPGEDIEGYLRLPAFDWHGEGPISFSNDVDVNHELMFSSPEMNGGEFMNWYGVKPEIAQFLPNFLAGTRLHGTMPNGDFGIRLSPRLIGQADLDERDVVRLGPDRVIANVAEVLERRKPSSASY